MKQTDLNLGPSRQETVSKAMLRSADLLGLSARELAMVVGLSEATLSRLKHGQGTGSLSGKAYELALLFIRMYRSLDAITGGDDSVSRRWLRAENAALRGIPAERIRSIDGLARAPL
jgi:transcriptional regulator with XRE-family HTH domain